MRKTRIVFIGSDDFDQAYTRVRCYKFSKLLESRGYETDVFAFQDEYFPGTEPFYMLNLNDSVKLRVTLKAFGRLWSDRGAIFYVQKAHYHAAAPFLLSRLRRNSYILDYDDWELDRATFFGSKMANRIFFQCTGVEGITAKLASRAAACVASTEPLKELLERYNDHVYLIPTAADTDCFKPDPRPKEKGKITFVWTGLVWGRDVFESVMFMLDCFRSFHSSCRNSELLIAGRGGWYGRMKEEIERQYGDLPIVLVGWVCPEKVPQVLAKADVGLLPLVPNAENEKWMSCKCPTKLFEFMAMAMPTVSSDFGEAHRIIRNGENGFLASDKKEFVEKMKLLATDRELRKQMGAKAREEAVSYYSLHAQRDALCKVVRIALGSGKQAGF